LSKKRHRKWAFLVQGLVRWSLLSARRFALALTRDYMKDYYTSRGRAKARIRDKAASLFWISMRVRRMHLRIEAGTNLLRCADEDFSGYRSQD
jgi:hypothetical protein